MDGYNGEKEEVPKLLLRSFTFCILLARRIEELLLRHPAYSGTLDSLFPVAVFDEILFLELGRTHENWANWFIHESGHFDELYPDSELKNENNEMDRFNQEGGFENA